MWTKFRGITKRSSSSPLRESSRSLPVPETEAVALSSPHGNPNGAARRPSRQSAVSEFDVEQTLNTVSLRSSQRSQDRSADPLGLTVVYAPKESPSVDIIFVHGLGGSSRQTWSKNRDPELFWPRTWLPSEPDICTARILTFGYNAHYRSLAPNNILSISDFAKNLLFEMRFGKDDATNDLKIGDVPIIFVVHSLGGLVFKRAYLQGCNNEEYKDIISQIGAVLFLSTPHRGTDLSQFLNRILTFSMIASPKQYITEIEQNSTTIELLNEEFRHFADRLDIFSFYETMQTTVGHNRIGMMILEKDSSILGYPREISLPLYADHHDVCKYASTQDSNYRSVRSVLKTLVSKYLEAGAKARDASRSADMLKVEKILSLSSPPEEDYDSLRHQRKSGTCERILSNGTFAHWTSQSGSSGVLWIHALPGSGKSVQSSYLIDHYTQSGHPCAYFFFKYNDSTKRSANSLLRSLIFQIARDVPTFHKVISQMSDDGLRLEKTDANTIWQQIFVSVLFKVDLSRPLYWVIDALDEAESTNTILKLLSDVSSSKTPIRVLIASRQTPAIATAFDRIAADIQVTPICTDDNSYDINLYATREIEYMHGTAEFRQEIVNRLVERAGGSFLWTHLALREIMQCHIEDDIKQALDDIPSGMESMYRRMETVITQLARDSDKTLAKLILTWATYSRRPVTATELSRALQPEISSVTDMKRTINEVCGQFVMIDSNNRISLIHHTAREYLTKTSELPFPFTSDDAHEYLFHKTLSVFIDRHVRSHLSQKTLPPFYAYAATSWAFHLKHCSAGSNASLDILAKFFQGAHVLPWIQALAVIGELRVLVFTSRILTTVVQKHRRIDKSRSPLLHRLSDLELLELWSIDLLKVVGKFGANLRQVPTAIYSCIPQFCPLNSVLHQQFGKPSSPVSVTGLSNADWDDCLARVSVGNEHPAEKITCSGRYVAVLNSAGTIALWDSLTFEEVRTFSHNEHVFTICFSGGGDRLASYGYLTTKIWSISTGQLLDIATNPTKARALCMTFADDDKILLMGSDLRKVRKLLLSCVAEGWQILDPSIMREETALEGTFLNSPTSLAFNSNATQIAVAYRGFPLSVWDLSNPRMVSRCKRRQNHGRKMSNAWTGVNRVIWHPNSGDILGIYTDGAVFKWHPLDGTHVELVGDFGDSPSEIQCSADGAVFATSDVNGTVRLFDFEHFALIYQLSSEDIVTALCFGPDGRRFYDLRASYINVWEPNALVRLSDSDDLASDVDTEARSTTMSYLASEAWADTSVQITACSARPQGGLVCIGNDDGIVELYEIDDQKKFEVARSSMGMNIEHVAWDEDGNHMVFLELGGKVTLNRVEFMPESKGGSRTRWRTVVSFKLSAETGQVHQLLLGPGSDYLLVASSYGGQLWSPKTKSLLASCTSAAPGILQKWVIHPSKRGQILALTPTTIIAYSWDTLKELGRWHISCPDLPSGKTAIENLGLPMKDFTGKSPSPEGEDQLIEHAMVTEGGRLILVQISQPGLARRRQSRVLVIEEATLTSGEIGSVEPCIVPHNIASIIEKPLGVLQKDKLVFLDSSFWVCTWRLGSADLQSTLPTRHFFLPRDWVNADSLKLCEIMADGTFLCPRKGEVAVVRSELGSDW